MFNRLPVAFIVLCLFSFNVLALGDDNPFDKSKSLSSGSDDWEIDKEAVVSTKTIADGGTYYHLRFDNKQIELVITSDLAGKSPKTFSQFEIKNVEIDSEQVPLFKWCLNNQERHSRFLQQGLVVKKGVCAIDSNAGTFVMRLNKMTLVSLQNGSRLRVSLKPFRTPLTLNYDISDFSDMYSALNAKPEPAVVKAPVVAAQVPVVPKAPAVAVSKPAKMCKAKAPAKYKKIKSVEYKCVDVVAKTKAEATVAKLVVQEKAKQQKIAAEKEKQRKLAEEKKQKELAAARDEQERRIQAEAAAVIEKQAQLGKEISAKMITMCNKFWTKGEHRCYCEKYIQHAPSGIESDPSCN